MDRWSDERRWAAREEAFGVASLDFWRWQERTAEAMWGLAAHNPPWPPADLDQVQMLLGRSRQWLAEGGAAALSPGLLLDGFRPLSTHLASAHPDLRLFIDGQLLISAQATAAETIALYGAAALDLPRRGVVQVEGGMIGIARHLERSFEASGGRIHYRQQVQSIEPLEQGGYLLRTGRKETFRADMLVANLTPPNLASLFTSGRPSRLGRLASPPADGWGAFTAYLGVRKAALADIGPSHHQILSGQTVREGSAIFLSSSPDWDTSRAPQGMRALTLSSHTRLQPWWRLFEADRPAYEARKQAHLEQLVDAADKAFPGLAEAVELALPGTPVTFQRYTGRLQGWVGGFPQTNLWRSWPSRLDQNLYLVGDSIFPGQSTAAVAMGGMRVAQQIIDSMPPRSPLRRHHWRSSQSGATRI
jgi:phytoene dehydrogenase-like protein